MIQVVHDKIVEFCGLGKIACVIVGSKSDLSMSYVNFWPIVGGFDCFFVLTTFSLILGDKLIRLTGRD